MFTFSFFHFQEEDCCEESSTKLCVTAEQAPFATTFSVLLGAFTFSTESAR